MTAPAALGVVSRFDDAAGYGFIAPDGGGPLLFFRGANIAADGRTTLADGERVEFEPREGGMGPEAMNVLPIESGGAS